MRSFPIWLRLIKEFYTLTRRRSCACSLRRLQAHRLAGHVCDRIPRVPTLGRGFLAAIVMLPHANTGNAAAGDLLDRSRLVMTFSEDFHAPMSFFDPTTGRGRWKTNYDFGQQSSISSRTLGSELEIYSDPAFNGINPFEQKDDHLIITAAKHQELDGSNQTNKPYTSGIITTSRSFLQTYGYFEMRGTLPQGIGLWPAFWLAAPLNPTITAPQFPGEIDVMEALGKHPNTIYCSAHWPVNAQASRQSSRTSTVRVSGGALARSYGVLWTKDALRWFVDDREVTQMANPGLHSAMAILVDLAVGGTWGGPPDSTTRFPAMMTIDYIRAYRIGP
jgi:beta-glucanase (GH16 family)